MKDKQKLYEINVRKNIDKTSLRPYKFTINVQFIDETFQARIKNILEFSSIVLCIQERGILNSLISKSKQKVFFNNWDYVEKINRNSFKIPIETIEFKCGENTYSYKERKNGEVEISLIEKAVREFLEKESEVYKSIG
ncbi:hypothetical protein HB665_15345 [Bacillus paranthracis]|uniref:hypothetical protein n=1 Tax=Bacillus cereus group TaxID=86661 RepID=UPI0014442882|nr:hypothetical protein [Bacillus paranthracis]NKX25541.1 hypothetical protein [Bacillus paranthracis]